MVMVRGSVTWVQGSEMGAVGMGVMRVTGIMGKRMEDYGQRSPYVECVFFLSVTTPYSRTPVLPYSRTRVPHPSPFCLPPTAHRLPPTTPPPSPLSLRLRLLFADCQPAGDADGLDQAARFGLTLPGDVEGGAVGDAGADDGQS
jgi:hypothetical protein